MIPLFLLIPLFAIPYADVLFLILVISVIFLVIYTIIKHIEFPNPWKQYALWGVAGLWILFLLYEALKISGIL